ncbi:cache domain-containing sensor histidine kinase [Saliterribacillus persicus]|uniref:Two-component system sensor histidine kinase YesM n=1 Tax=Saliterribacillus persicus TaxID=930114 RepID=A0A368YB14_9BACI|nr:histidine kinase [Saliterribacillus persicus]RCW76889.1 two-component system sensor histidine kinase YesM [Saliterribacillus persicus]
MNDIKLKNKLFLSFVFVVFVPIIMIGGYLTNQLKQVALEEAIEQAELDMERVQKRTAELLKVPIFISNNIQYDRQLEEIINTDYQELFDVVNDYRNYKTFLNLVTMYEEINNIRFYVENPTLLNNWDIIPANEKIKNSSWYLKAKNEKGIYRWRYLEDETYDSQKFLSLIRRIDFVDYNTEGILVVSINEDSLNWILTQESEAMMLVNGDNYIYAANRPNYIGKKLQNIVNAKEIEESKLGNFRGVVEGEESQVFIGDIQVGQVESNLRVVSVISEDSIVKNANHFKRLGFIIVLISVAVSLTLIYYFSKLLTNRLAILIRQINLVGKGDFDTTMVIDGKDELGILSKHLDSMVANTKSLINEVVESNHQKTLMERKQNEIKFKMMASQINPHFLFNVLESIRMEAYVKGEKEIASVIKTLGKLMRKNLEVGSGKVELSREIEIVKSYLEIQKFRHEDRLSYDILVSPLAEKVLIPPLIIQPLVENAVVHGLEKQENPVEINVIVKKVNNKLIAQVIDNGIGISEEKQNEIHSFLNEIEDNDGDRIGLRNVHQRLRLTYGENAGLVIESKQGIGTKVCFSVLVQEE